MRAWWIFTLVFIAAVKPVAGQLKLEPIHQVQPEYSADLQRSFLVDFVNVELSVGETGVPLHLRANWSLPDNVVQALMQWRYRPGKAVSLTLQIPVRRPLTTDVAASLQRPWLPVDPARIADPETTEQRLLPLSNGPGIGAVWLGDLFGLTALGVTCFDEQTGRPIAANESVVQSTFGAKARSALRETANRRVLLSALNTVTSGGRALAQANQLPADFSAFCGELLERVQQFFPTTAATCDTREDISDIPIPPPLLHLSPMDCRLNLLNMPPMHCPVSLTQGFEGTFKFEGVIGRDGTVHEIELTDGSLGLYECVRKALLKASYKPVIVNGNSVEVTSSIGVEFQFGTHAH